MQHWSQGTGDHQIAIGFLDRSRIRQLHHHVNQNEMDDHPTKDENHPAVPLAGLLMANVKNRQSGKSQHETVNRPLERLGHKGRRQRGFQNQNRRPKSKRHV